VKHFPDPAFFSPSFPPHEATDQTLSNTDQNAFSFSFSPLLSFLLHQIIQTISRCSFLFPSLYGRAIITIMCGFPQSVNGKEAPLSFPFFLLCLRPGTYRFHVLFFRPLSAGRDCFLFGGELSPFPPIIEHTWAFFFLFPIPMVGIATSLQRLRQKPRSPLSPPFRAITEAVPFPPF